MIVRKISVPFARELNDLRAFNSIKNYCVLIIKSYKADSMSRSRKEKAKRYCFILDRSTPRDSSRFSVS